MRPAVLPAGEDTVVLELLAEKEIVPGMSLVRLIGKVEDQQLPAETVTLTIKKRDQPEMLPPPAARPLAPQRVEFPTADGVQLVGRFYPGPKGKPSNPVLLLHDLEQHKGEDLYAGLALALQSKGYAVLSFDFRGHGRSKGVSPEFWNAPHNKLLPRRGRPANTIQAQDFPAPYWHTLVNDIAAARRDLDLLNDQKVVNSSNLVLVAAGRAATLGSLWLASEWYRAEKGNPAPEGSTIAAAVWLSIDPGVGGQAQPVGSWMQTPARPTARPCFLSTARAMRRAATGPGSTRARPVHRVASSLSS